MVVQDLERQMALIGRGRGEDLAEEAPPLGGFPEFPNGLELSCKKREIQIKYFHYF